MRDRLGFKEELMVAPFRHYENEIYVKIVDAARRIVDEVIGHPPEPPT